MLTVEKRQQLSTKEGAARRTIKSSRKVRGMPLSSVRGKVERNAKSWEQRQMREMQRDLDKSELSDEEMLQ